MSVFERAIPRLSPIAILLSSTFLTLFLYLVAHIFTAQPGHDQSWYLFAAKRILNGDVPYGPHLAETNPPLILWFSTLPVLWAETLHLEATTAFRLLVLLLSVSSAVWCRRILRHSRLFLKDALPTLMACAVLIVELSSGVEHFGQREHLFVILVLPYILAGATGVIGSSPGASRLSIAERCALGFAAGFAVSLKPQEALVIVAVELFFVFVTRSLQRAISPDFLSLVFTALLYVAAVRVFAPLYQTRTVPILFNTYWTYGPLSISTVARSFKAIYLAIFDLLLICYILRKKFEGSLIAATLLVCSLAAYVAYDVQHNEWFYHFLPVVLFLALAAMCLAIELLTDRYHKNKFGSLLTLPIVIALVALEFGTLAFHVRQQPTVDPLDAIFRQCPPNTKVYIFSTDLGFFSSVYSHHLDWGSRFNVLWMLPAIVSNEQPEAHPPAKFKKLSPETLKRLATLQHAETTEDLNRWQPSLIIVKRCSLQDPCQAIENPDFDILAWFLKSPDFAAAWSHYKRQSESPQYEVYVRTH
jgi:hypothetical protein